MQIFGDFFGHFIANEYNIISLFDNYEGLPSGWAYGIFVNIPCALEIDSYCLVVVVFYNLQLIKLIDSVAEIFFIFTGFFSTFSSINEMECWNLRIWLYLSPVVLILTFVHEICKVIYYVISCKMVNIFHFFYSISKISPSLTASHLSYKVSLWMYWFIFFGQCVISCYDHYFFMFNLP